MKGWLALAGMIIAASAFAQDTRPHTVWRSLLDARGSAWRGWKSEEFPPGWTISGDEISKDGEVEDLVSREPFGDFELEFEWKIGEGGNSGVFYRGTREYDYIFWSAPEYQLLDDANAPDGRNRLTSAAAAYGLYAAPAGVVKPHGEWNAGRIVVDGAHVEHWLNGRKVVEYELGSPDWKAKVAASKFGKWPNYGLARKGCLGIQGDHPGALALRNIRIRELR
jgi:3-keto-disaccharide hydrolase